MIELISRLVQYLVDQLFPTFFSQNGAEKESNTNVDKLWWLIELIIFILQYLFTFYISSRFRVPVLLTQFLIRIVPHFLQWLIEKAKNLYD